MTARRPPAARKWMRPSPTLVVGLIACAYLAAVLWAHDGDPLSLARIGTRFSQHDPQGSEGYDGQFAYYVALDPAGARPHLDVPAYRYQRILYPLLARALALGQPAAIPWALVAVNLAALAGGTYATERLLAGYGVSRWYALTYGLYAGQLLALRTDLNEPLAHALVQWSILAYERKRPGWSAVCLGLAVFAKETALVFVAGYLLYFALARRGKRLAGFAAITVLPFLLYQIFLKWWLGDFGVGSGGAGATPFSLLPFGGILAIGRVSVPGLLLFLAILTPLVVVPTLLGLYLTARDVGQRAWHPVTLALLANGVVMLFLPNSTYREIAATLRLSIGLVAMTILYGGLRRSSRTLNYSLLWLAALVFLVKE